MQLDNLFCLQRERKMDNRQEKYDEKYDVTCGQDSNTYHMFHLISYIF